MDAKRWTGTEADHLTWMPFKPYNAAIHANPKRLESMDFIQQLYTGERNFDQ
jgi:hypothetical protein